MAVAVEGVDMAGCVAGGARADVVTLLVCTGKRTKHVGEAAKRRDGGAELGERRRRDAQSALLRAGTRARSQQRRYRRPGQVDGAAEVLEPRLEAVPGRATRRLRAMGVHAGKNGGRRTCQRGGEALMSPGGSRRG